MKRKEKDAIIGTQVIRRISSYVKDHASKKRKEKDCSYYVRESRESSNNCGYAELKLQRRT